MYHSPIKKGPSAQARRVHAANCNCEPCLGISPRAAFIMDLQSAALIVAGLAFVATALVCLPGILAAFGIGGR